MKLLDNWKKLLLIIIVLIIFIFFTAGFLMGYLNADKTCMKNPFSYGLKKISSMNNINLTCSCFSLQGEVNPFSFDEKGIKKY